MKKYLAAFVLFFSVKMYGQNPSLKLSSKNEMKERVVTVYTSADSTNLRLTITGNTKFTEHSQPIETQTCVFVFPYKKFQTFIGIGGAITDASAEVFATLPEDKQKELLNAYYSKDKGIGYTIIRTNIHSCDFSSGSYTYVKEGDTALSSFSIEHDMKYRVPLIKRAMEVSNNKAQLFASPWSPPAFMKDNNNILHGGKLLPAFYQSWANYFVKFIKSYQAAGVPVWGMTVQNEPMATQQWESCIFTAKDERDFLKKYLGPTLASNGLGDKKIIVWDHNRDLIAQRASIILEDQVAKKFVWGIGYHWYEDWSGSDQMFENIEKVRTMYPDKNLFFTEGCADSFNDQDYQHWANGEKYGRSMINDFNNGTVGWTDWNVLLDEHGGPNHVGNFCFAPVHANTKTGELIYTPSYYYIGHFSKFIEKGAKRIGTVTSRSQLSSTSFVNPGGKMVTVVMNSSNKKIVYYLCVDNKSSEITILPHSIQTLVY